MTELEAREFFDHLPLDERLRLVRQILGDIEGRISRARDELNGGSPQLILPSLEGLEAPPGEPRELEPPPSGAAARAGGGDLEPEGPDWDSLDLDELTGGKLHPVHRLRLADAAAQYEKLLKRYGYIKGAPEPREILRQEMEAALIAKKARTRSDTAWAEWVARDADTLDRPQSRDWQGWVTKADEEAGAEPDA